MLSTTLNNFMLDSIIFKDMARPYLSLQSDNETALHFFYAIVIFKSEYRVIIWEK